MKKLTVILCALLIVGHMLTELGSILYLVYRPQAWRIDPFLDSDYEFPGGEGIDLYWWIKWVTDDLLWCITYFVLAKIAYQYSFRLFLIGSIFFLYHVIDHFMLWWNYKTSYWLYWIMLAAIIGTIASLFAPEKKQAIIKSLQ